MSLDGTCRQLLVAGLYTRTSPLQMVTSEDELSDQVEDVSEDPILQQPKKRKPSPTQWTDKYSPKSLGDICINPRKLAEVTTIFKNMVNGSGPRLLLLTGPSGCSKSTVAKGLAQKFVAPLCSDSNFLIEYLDSTLEMVNQPNHFPDFLDGCRYRVNGSISVILIEELPNVFHEPTLNAFRTSLRDWIYTNSQLPPLILCLTELDMVPEYQTFGYLGVSTVLMAETLLGRELLSMGISDGRIERVKFLPIAKTYMKKTLNLIVAKERVETPGQFLEGLIECGDIRSLINQLQFWTQSLHVTNSPEVLQEGAISIFHATGKIIYSSKKGDGKIIYSSEKGDGRDDRFNGIQLVVDTYHDFELLHLSLLENYHIYNGLDFELEIAAKLVDSLSLSDQLVSTDAYKEYGIRATRRELSRVDVRSSRSLGMKFPRQFKMMKASNKVKKEVYEYQRYITRMRLLFSEINLLDGHFLPHIYNSFKYKMRMGNRPRSYNRIGGKFKEIYADETVSGLESKEAEELDGDQFKLDIQKQIQSELEDRNGFLEDEFSEEIEFSDDDDDFDDTLDERLLGLSEQNSGHANGVKIGEDLEILGNSVLTDTDEDFNDDPHLDLLVSQGML